MHFRCWVPKFGNHTIPYSAHSEATRTLACLSRHVSALVNLRFNYRTTNRKIASLRGWLRNTSKYFTEIKPTFLVWCSKCWAQLRVFFNKKEFGIAWLNFFIVYTVSSLLLLKLKVVRRELTRQERKRSKSDGEMHARDWVWTYKSMDLSTVHSNGVYINKFAFFFSTEFSLRLQGKEREELSALSKLWENALHIIYKHFILKKFY